MLACPQAHSSLPGLGNLLQLRRVPFLQPLATRAVFLNAESGGGNRVHVLRVGDHGGILLIRHTQRQRHGEIQLRQQETETDKESRREGEKESERVRERDRDTEIHKEKETEIGRGGLEWRERDYDKEWKQE